MGILVGVWLSKLDFGLFFLKESETCNKCSRILVGLFFDVVKENRWV